MKEVFFMRKKQFMKIRWKSLTLISFVILFNCLGVSYAFWNDGLQLSKYVSTGNILLVLKDDYLLEPMAGVSDLSVDIEEGALNIHANVVPGYKGRLTYTVLNKGSVPVVYNNQTILPLESKEFALDISSEFKKLEVEYTQIKE
jgi:hypothetical protein